MGSQSPTLNGLPSELAELSVHKTVLGPGAVDSTNAINDSLLNNHLLTTMADDKGLLDAGVGDVITVTSAPAVSEPVLNESQILQQQSSPVPENGLAEALLTGQQQHAGDSNGSAVLNNISPSDSKKTEINVNNVNNTIAESAVSSMATSLSQLGLDSCVVDPNNSVPVNLGSNLGAALDGQMSNNFWSASSEDTYLAGGGGGGAGGYTQGMNGPALNGGLRYPQQGYQPNLFNSNLAAAQIQAAQLQSTNYHQRRAITGQGHTGFQQHRNMFVNNKGYPQWSNASQQPWSGQPQGQGSWPQNFPQPRGRGGMFGGPPPFTGGGGGGGRRGGYNNYSPSRQYQRGGGGGGRGYHGYPQRGQDGDTGGVQVLLYLLSCYFRWVYVKHCSQVKQRYVMRRCLRNST